VIKPGDVQYMSAGTRAVAAHEFNAYETNRFICTKLDAPKKQGLEATLRHKEHLATPRIPRGKLRLVASRGLGATARLKFRQDNDCTRQFSEPAKR